MVSPNVLSHHDRSPEGASPTAPGFPPTATPTPADEPLPTTYRSRIGFGNSVYEQSAWVSALWVALAVALVVAAIVLTAP
jgi:hypothetical protein